MKENPTRLICFLLLLVNLANSSECNLDLNIYKNKYGMFYVPSDHFRPSVNAIKKGQVWEQDTLEFIATIHEKDSSLVHAGAYFGDMLPFFSALVGDGIVFAFEPVEDNFYFANKNIELNRLKNIELFNFALSDNNQPLYMQTVENGVCLGGGSKVVEKMIGNQNDIKVIAVRLDDVLLGDQRRISVIHLDIEGHEIIALEGSKETIKKNRPIIILEMWNEKVTDINNYMRSINYRLLKMIDGNGVFFPNEKEFHQG